MLVLLLCCSGECYGALLTIRVGNPKHTGGLSVAFLLMQSRWFVLEKLLLLANELNFSKPTAQETSEGVTLTCGDGGAWKMFLRPAPEWSYEFILFLLVQPLWCKNPQKDCSRKNNLGWFHFEVLIWAAIVYKLTSMRFLFILQWIILPSYFLKYNACSFSI